MATMKTKLMQWQYKGVPEALTGALGRLLGADIENVRKIDSSALEGDA